MYLQNNKDYIMLNIQNGYHLKEDLSLSEGKKSTSVISERRRKIFNFMF